MRLTTAACLWLALGVNHPAFACGQQPYVGDICPFATRDCPHGYLEAAGQQLPLHSNPVLFSVFGTTYGGNGTTSFNVPDLRGREVIGLNFEGANGLPQVILGEEVAAKSGPNTANAQGQALAVKFCIALWGAYPPRE